jgi:hypothetical protein
MKAKLIYSNQNQNKEEKTEKHCHESNLGQSFLSSVYRLADFPQVHRIDHVNKFINITTPVLLGKYPFQWRMRCRQRNGSVRRDVKGWVAVARGQRAILGSHFCGKIINSGATLLL